MTDTVSTVFTTANIEGSLDDAQARTAIAIALRGSDVVATQEMQRRHAEQYVDGSVWATVQGKAPSARGRCAIYYRRDRFREVGRGNPVLHLSNLYDSANRYFEWVRLQDRETGRYWTILDIHFGPHADDERGGITKMPRGRLVRLAISVIVAFVKRTTGNVVVLGDFNVDARRDLEHYDPNALIERFDRARLSSSARVLQRAIRTHGGNSYDQAFVRLVRGAGRIVRQWTRKNGPGDHLAYSVEVEQTRRRGWHR